MSDGNADQTLPSPAPEMDYPEMVEVDPDHYVVADEIAKRLADTDTTNQRWRKDLAGTYKKLAEVYTAASDRTQAASAAQQADHLRAGNRR